MDLFGTVIDSRTGDTLPHVTVAVLTSSGHVTGRGTISDRNGVFDLRNVSPGEVVQFSMVGYRTNAPTLREYPHQNVVTLEQAAIGLPEAVVTAKQTYVWAYVLAATVVALIALFYFNKD